MTDTTPVTCPTCFEEFEVPCPGTNEVPTQVDYDCEVCCRPMLIHFWLEESAFNENDIVAEASGLDD